VKLVGKGLSGPTSFHLLPRKTDIYTAFYNPIFSTSGDFERGYVFFSSSQYGEFCYELHLRCEDIKPFILNRMESELGFASVQVLSIENPLDFTLKLETWSSNPTVFSVFPMTPLLSRGLKEENSKQEEDVGLNEVDELDGLSHSESVNRYDDINKYYGVSKKMNNENNSGSGVSLKTIPSSNVIMQTMIKSLVPSKIPVAPLSHIDAVVRYTPSTVNKEEEAELRLISERAGSLL
jgi:hypothetical protein